MDPKKALDTLQKLGAGISPRTAVLLLVVAPLAIALVALLWKKRAALAKLVKRTPRASIEGPAEPPSVTGGQLRATWRKFLQTLPPTYRRSILSFDHFVVFGDAASGKSLVVDRYTDFRRQAKQFLGSHVFDSHIDLYIGSRSVIMEVAANVLYDVGPKCQSALRKLWAPLYQRYAPTVIVVVDAERLKRADYDLVDYAERLRGKINLLSGICKKPLELRVVLTHLDENPGFDAFAELCKSEQIPLYMPVVTGPDQQPMAAQLDAWLEYARGHLARALIRGGSAQLRACVNFLRAAQSFPKPLAKFFEVLFAPETFSQTPRSGGVYLASPQVAEPNPLQGRPIGQQAPDPRVRHRKYATGLAAVVVLYLCTAFSTQSRSRVHARDALDKYKPAALKQEQERALREDIQGFTCEGCRPIARVPDFFGDVRIKAREEFSERVRTEVLIPNLRKVARDGFVALDTLPNHARRALFYLALIHSDRSDTFHIRKDSKRLRAWAAMTELPPELIEMYLETTEGAYPYQVDFKLPDQFDERDLTPYWHLLLDDIDKAMEGKSIDAEALKTLQTRATGAAEALKRFEHDDLIEEILKVMLGSDTREPLAINTQYRLTFEKFIDARKAVDLAAGHENYGNLSVLLQTIRASYVEAPEVPLVATLGERLSSLYDLPPGGGATKARTVAIADRTYQFDPARWALLVRNAQASAFVAALMNRSNSYESVFIPGGQAALSFSSQRWNETNDGTATFVGRAEIKPAYTRAGYDALVREPVQKLEQTLEKASLPSGQKEQLKEFVTNNIHTYAVRYKKELEDFYRAFGLSASSFSELRTAIAQMAVDESVYGAFLHVVHRQVDLDTRGELLGPMAYELRELAGLRHLFDHDGTEAEIGKYRAILGQLLHDLGTPEDTQAADADPLRDPARETLDAALGQAGRVALQSARGEKGSYAQLVRQWYASLGLPAKHIGPFMAPIFELENIGLGTAQKVVKKAWEEQLAAELQRIRNKFPFDRGPHAEDVKPQELDELINPTSGRLTSFVRRYLDPLADPRVQGRFQLRDAFRRRLALPERMEQTIRASELLTSRLYDEKGRAAPLKVSIATVPFEHGTDPRYGLTLVYLSVGEASLHNFNQRPSLTTMKVDWTREQISQVGIQLMNLDSQEKLYPEPLATPASHWSVLRLLAAAQTAPVKKPENAQLYTWHVRHQPTGGRSTAVRFIVLGDPFAPFSLGAER